MDAVFVLIVVYVVGRAKDSDGDSMAYADAFVDVEDTDEEVDVDEIVLNNLFLLDLELMLVTSNCFRFLWFFS